MLKMSWLSPFILGNVPYQDLGRTTFVVFTSSPEHEIAIKTLLISGDIGYQVKLTLCHDPAWSAPPPAISALYSPQLSSKVWAGVRNEALMTCTIRRPWSSVQEAPSLPRVVYVCLLDMCTLLKHPLAPHFYFWQLYWLFLLYFNKSVLLYNLVCGTPIHVTCRELVCDTHTHIHTHS